MSAKFKNVAQGLWVNLNFVKYYQYLIIITPARP